jgi:hypothetical protein
MRVQFLDLLALVFCLLFGRFGFSLCSFRFFNLLPKRGRSSFKPTVRLANFVNSVGPKFDIELPVTDLRDPMVDLSECPIHLAVPQKSGRSDDSADEQGGNKNIRKK